MKRKINTILSLMLVFLMALSLFTTSAFAAEIHEDHACGLVWELDEDGCLYISGCGEIENFIAKEEQPWKDVREEIVEVMFDEDAGLQIGSIAYWFEDCVNLRAAILPEYVTVIGCHAFYNCPALHDLMLTSVPTIFQGAFITKNPMEWRTGYDPRLQIVYYGEAEPMMSTLCSYDWGADECPVHIQAFGSVSTFALTAAASTYASGYCPYCKATYSYSLGYSQWTADVHCVRHWCSNCGYDQCEGGNAEAHTFSGNTCTKCGYSTGSGGGTDPDPDPGYCSHYSSYTSWSGCYWYEYCYSCGVLVDYGVSHGSTYTTWSGCDWYEYCRNCDTLIDYGTSHSAYNYGDWTYYNTYYHRRTNICTSCGNTVTETGRHSTQYKYTPYSSTQHQYGSYCSACETYIGSSSTQNHTLTYGSWENYSASQHRRTVSCSTCGYSDYEYADHSFTYSAWSSISESQHSRTKSCSCGYSTTETGSHADGNNDGKCDACGYVMGITVTWDASANGGTIGGFSGMATKVKNGDYPTAPTQTPSKTGYDFTGWYTEISGGELCSNVRILSETTFYAHYAPAIYNITWDTQFFTVSRTSQAYGEKLIFPTEPRQDGYVFLGWFTESNGGDEIAEGMIYEKTEDSTFYAHWEEAPVVFSVTVPATLTLTVSETGRVYSPDTASIINNSTDAVKVTAVTVRTENGWQIVPFPHNMADEKVDSKKIGFWINGCPTASVGTSESLNMYGEWSIEQGSSIPVSYEAVVSASSAPISEQVLTLVFVLDWA